MRKVLTLLCLVITSVLSLQGCSDNVTEHYTKEISVNLYKNYTITYREVCINGVIYYAGSRALSAKFDRLGNIVTCDVDR